MKLRQARKLLNSQRKYIIGNGQWIYAPAIIHARPQTAKRCMKRIHGLSGGSVKVNWFWRTVIEARRLAAEHNHVLWG